MCSKTCELEETHSTASVLIKTHIWLDNHFAMMRVWIHWSQWINEIITLVSQNLKNGTITTNNYMYMYLSYSVGYCIWQELKEYHLNSKIQPTAYYLSKPNGAY